jgi:hypothetical protein
MSFLFYLAAPSGEAIAAGTGIVLVVAIAAIAYIAFRIFRKTLKMAFRMAILAAILIFVLGGGIGLWWFGSSKPAPQATPQKTR